MLYVINMVDKGTNMLSSTTFVVERDSTVVVTKESKSTLSTIYTYPIQLKVQALHNSGEKQKQHSIEPLLSAMLDKKWSAKLLEKNTTYDI